MAKSTLRKRFLLYKKAISIIIAILLLLALSMIVTFVCMKDSVAKIYLIITEAIFILVLGNGIYMLLSEKVGSKIKPKKQRVYLSDEKYKRFVEASKANDKYAK